ncbi:PREDICTED: polyadenylate-binding protein 7-like isoform X2 [Lupinus angustifolius]|uniref:polyadenylate-binding protein 7-like isoform X2 n=1 Tax=Lupinus angustifolius TaxID=3871 RepID=UPI00092E59EC|nr:PREDICTED: polyadenylate-binding protein 7-like isoform X2 [Lupinus angustifolius]
MAVPSPTVTIVPASLYVGDLHPDVSEGQIFELFSEFKSLASVRVCRDTSTGKSLCYGYVNFVSPQDAIRAIELKNHAILNGKAIRVMWSRRDPGARKNNSANVFVKNLAESIDNAGLEDLFKRFGNILSSKVVMSENGKSKGYGFVQFESEESANAAIEKLNGSTVGDKQIYVDRFVKKSDCVLPGSEARYTNLYMKNLDLDITEAVLQEKFSSFGKIVSLAIAKDNKGVSKGFGFVNYDNADDAKRTLEAMNGTQFGSKIIYVARAQKKSERQQILTNQFEEKRKEKIIKYEGSNIYVKNIDDNVSDEELRDQFSSCGTITSAKIMRNSKGISKGFGFVCFSTPEEANIAVNNFHGFMFHGKPLYVALAQRKEDRQAYLQLQYAQKIAGPSTAATPGGYPPLYYAAAGVTSQVPLGAGLVYQSRALRPGWRANAYASPARSFQQSPVPVLTGQAKYVTSGHHGKMVKGSEFTSGASNYSGGSQGSEMLYTMLSAAAPNQQKQILATWPRSKDYRDAFGDEQCRIAGSPGSTGVSFCKGGRSYEGASQLQDQSFWTGYNTSFKVPIS